MRAKFRNEICGRVRNETLAWANEEVVQPAISSLPAIIRRASRRSFPFRIIAYRASGHARFVSGGREEGGGGGSLTDAIAIALRGVRGGRSEGGGGWRGR